MTTRADRAIASPTHFSEDDSEDDGLNLDAYLKVGAVQKQEAAGSSRGRKLRGGIDQEDIGLLMAKAGARGKVVDPEPRQRVTSKGSSTIKSKATPKVEGSTANMGGDLGGLSLSGTTSTQKNKRTQRPLKTAQVNPLLLPLSQPVADKNCAKGSQAAKKGSRGKVEEEEEQGPEVKSHGNPDIADAPEFRVRERNSARTTSKRTTKKEVNYQGPLAISDDGKNDETFDSLADFIVSDNEDASLYESHGESGEDKTPIQENKPRGRLIRGRTPKSTLQKKGTTGYKESSFEEALSREPVDLTLPPSLHLKPTKQLTGKKAGPEKPCQSQHSDELHVSDALPKNSPPRPNSPPTMGGTGFITPPSSPSKPRLKSPSKEKPRIPESPHRPSIDAFWSQDVINEWNDQYSPKKEQTPFRRRMLMLLGEEDEEDEVALNTSPKKGGGASPTKTSPTKARAAAAEAKKAIAKKKKEFDEKKVALAENFFQELDEKVTNGEIQKLAEATGGVKIIWSKKLNSTAGRANWKRETIRSKPSSPTEKTQTSRHHATIELAEKVIDSPDRLINTLAHEYCHLTNFMISNIRNNPHGASFKEWAQKCTAAFADHPVYGGGAIKVTTKHSYVISYKYIWCCEGCGLEYGRHSKSIDPVKVRCGRCKGGLRQVKPTPRRGAGAGTQKKNKPKKDEAVVVESPVVDMLVDEDEGSGVEAVTKDLADVKLRA